ncbi:AGRG4-like protein [Mya arenaria]|uniref:AGRG4-like protein n=1 Tax=Mya arenaria TaxID=6604 RepID=A0ABY7EMR7_MYAAR|nr:AGRG4-like protein [Mya arenaria]
MGFMATEEPLNILFDDHNNLVCSYWDNYADEAAGGWGTEGCSMTSYVNNTVVCKHLRNGRSQQVLINLSVSILCSAILFLVGMERTESHGGCIAVAALLRYFILVSFMWMLVEGTLQYLRFVFGTYIPKFMIKTMIPASGIPLIPLLFIGKSAVVCFYHSVMVVILANLIVFTLVMCSLFKRKTNIMMSNQSELKMALLHFQAVVFAMPRESCAVLNPFTSLMPVRKKTKERLQTPTTNIPNYRATTQTVQATPRSGAKIVTCKFGLQTPKTWFGIKLFSELTVQIVDLVLDKTVFEDCLNFDKMTSESLTIHLQI